MLQPLDGSRVSVEIGKQLADGSPSEGPLEEGLLQECAGDGPQRGEEQQKTAETSLKRDLLITLKL